MRIRTINIRRNGRFIHRFNENDKALFAIDREYAKREAQFEVLRDAAKRAGVSFYSTWWQENGWYAYIPHYIRGINIDRMELPEYDCIREQYWAIAEGLGYDPRHIS